MKANCPYGILHKKLLELQQLLQYLMCKTDAETQEISGSLTEEISAKLGFLKTLLGIEMENCGSSKMQAQHLNHIADWLSTVEAWSKAQPKGGILAPPFCSVCAKNEEGVSDICLCNDSCFEEEGMGEGDSVGDAEELMAAECGSGEGDKRAVGWNKRRVAGIVFAVGVTLVGVVTRFSSMERRRMLVPT